MHLERPKLRIEREANNCMMHLLSVSDEQNTTTSDLQAARGRA